MVNTGQDFALNSLQEAVHTDPYVIEKATKTIKRLHAAGKIGAIEDWDGDPVEGWLDILGLNGRPIKQNRINGVREHTPRQRKKSSPSQAM